MRSISRVTRKWGAALGVLAMLASCGGGGGGGGGGGIGGPAPNPNPTPGGCALSDRQQWAATQLREWYLFPETLPASLSPSGYASVQDYIDALTATARAQGRDRYFTYITSIGEEDDYYENGANVGYGFRLAFDGASRVFVTESFEGTSALNNGVDRGTEILAIGTNSGNLRTISDLLASGGTAALTNALGPDTEGTTRVFRVNTGTIQTVTLTKNEYDLQPVSPRYGSRIIDEGGRRVGYVNLRTFITTADPALRAVFADFRAQGITEVIIDLRYNGGGLISVAENFGDLLGRNRFTSDIYSRTIFRPEKSSNNRTRYFSPRSESIAPTRIAFIGFGGTASASEMLINAFIPYLGANAALIGSNTYGKPVGQIAIDRTACDDRLRIVALATQNSAGNANYYNGLASSMQATCRASDDISRPLGDPLESATRAALDFLAGRGCSAITAEARGDALDVRVREGAIERRLISPERPSTAQREVPGLF